MATRSDLRIGTNRRPGAVPASLHAVEDAMDQRVAMATLADGPALRNRRPWYDVTHLTTALGVLVTLTAGFAAQAGDILRGGAPAGTRGGSAGSAIPAQATQSNTNAKDALARTTQAVQAVQAMQKAARQVATGANNLGINPNAPGQFLPNVPNGLTPGGLQVAPGVPVNLDQPAAGEDPKLWTGANLPFQASSGGRSTVAIRQTKEQAVLTWQTFNVGKETTLEFDQSMGGDKRTQWVAFNKIVDPSGAPSQILGSIKADGQVYVINRNGIIFGGTSQVNTHGLVASSLAINDNLIKNGLLNNPNAEFLLAAPAGSNALPGDVVVQAGALLSSPTTPEHVGGRIALIGPNVTNSGTIETPDGQTILAAGLQVGFAAHDSADPHLRGLDVFVGAATATTGSATNFGLIFAERASVVLTGKSVNQMGVIDSSTSVTLNGQIDLLADYNAVRNAAYDPVNLPSIPPFYFQSAGTVTLGTGSVTRILPELSSSDTVASTALPLNSRANLRGQAIHLAADSTLLAPSAEVKLLAGMWDFRQTTLGTPTSQFVFTSSASPSIHPQIYLDSGAMINVAGTTNVEVPIGQNILSLQPRGAELADSPLQRNGPVRGVEIHVDLRIHGPWNPALNDGKGDYEWVGTPLANAKGYRDLIQRSVGELTVAGGSVSLTSGGSVVLQLGSTIDVSGGWINYQGGMIETTRLMSGGQLIDISQATPDRIYDRIYTGTFAQTHPKYGLSETFTNPLALSGAHFEPGYISGAPGGKIAITAPSVALDGAMLGNTVAGPAQRADPPLTSSLALTFQQQDTTAQHYFFSPTPPEVLFKNGASVAAVEPFTLDALGNPLDLSADRRQRVVLSPDLLTESGFGNLTVDNGEGEISVPENVTLSAPVRGSISLLAANLTIDGHISAPGGTLKFVAYNFSPFSQHLFQDVPPTIAPSPNADRGLVTLGPTASLSTTGLIVDDQPTAAHPNSLPLVIDGGTITIGAYSANLAVGSSIDVSGGISVTFAGKRSLGKAGKIDISTGTDPATPSIAGGKLILGTTLRGYSGVQGGGGSLSIQAPLVQIGGTAPQIVRTPGSGPEMAKLDINGTLVDQDEFLFLDPAFFNQGGFQSFTVKGLGAIASGSGQLNQYLPGVFIAPGTVIAPRAESFVPVVFGNGSSEVELRTTRLSEALRSPVSLAFNAVGINDSFAQALVVRGDFVMGAGATIQTDPFPDASRGVTITGRTVEILGSINAPGGLIQITGAATSTGLTSTALRALTTVHISRNTILSAAGKSVIVRDGRGLRVGTIFGGGTISISGNILAESGAVIDVSGASDILDLPPQSSSLSSASVTPGTINSATGSLQGQPVVATRVDSNAGSIVLKGGQILFSDATLIGTAGGPNALGGSLQISSGIFLVAGSQQTPLDATLTVKQGGNAIPDSFKPGDGAMIGQPVIDLPGKDASGGFITVKSFAAGGFDRVNLQGTVKFAGPISLSVGRELRVADGGVILADDAVHLRAPYVALGTAFQAPLSALQQQQQAGVFALAGVPFYFGPTYGAGNLTVEGDLIDIGNLSLQGIGQANFVARGGEIRGDGTLDVAGSITMIAAQVYPATAVNFMIAAYDKNITVASSAVGNTRVTLASATLPPGFQVGSPLLGSTVVSIAGNIVTLASGANAAITGKPVTFEPGSGSVTIIGSGTRQLPLSVGGTLSIYGSTIQQGGTVVAPGGSINIGWDGTGSSPIDYISGAGLTGSGALKLTSVATAQTINLLAGSVTSVSLVDPVTKQPMFMPYGLNLNGVQWIDPIGTDITAGGIPGKSITLSGVRLTTDAGSLIDISGGGDLMSYRWVPGVGGSKDVLSSSTSFAVIPNYQSNYAPYAPFNTNPTTDNLEGDPGYVNGNLRAGDRISLQGGGGLPAGEYTLLPARYALLPGAFLITPQSGATVGTFINPDGSSIVSGRRTGQTLWQRYEIAPSEVIRSRSQYEQYFANSFLLDSAQALEVQVPRLPIDSGHLILSGSSSLALLGDVNGRAPGAGRGGLIDISSSADIYVTSGRATVPPGSVVLDASLLNSYGAESLLVGGIRQFGPTATTITVKTRNLTLDNAGEALVGPEIILVAREDLTLAPNAEIEQKGSIPRAESGQETPLLIGSASVPGSGDGTLLRVSAVDAAIVRSGVSSSVVPDMTIGPGVRLAGSSLTLDSTAGTHLDPTAILKGDHIALNSGRISIQFTDPGLLPTDAGLVLAGSALASLESAQSLSLLSYSSIDLYGHGAFSVAGLELHAAEIRGFHSGGDAVTFTTGQLLLDNLPNRPALGPVDPTSNGTLRFNAGTIRLGVNQLKIEQYATLELNASGGILLQGAGGLSTSGNLIATTPFISGEAKANTTISAGGVLTFERPAGISAAQTPVEGGLGVSLTLEGSSIVANSDIVLPSGLIKLHATDGDVTVGGRLEVSGTAQRFFDLIKYTNAGQISLLADRGSVTVTTDAVLSVAAHPTGGDAGTLAISAPGTTAAPGTFTLDGKVFGQGGTFTLADGTVIQGQGGTFLLDVGVLPSIASLDPALNFNDLTRTGGFTTAQNIRVRNGDVAVDGTATTHSFDLSVDQGSIVVTNTGKVDAHGATGGTINLMASGSVILEDGSLLTVEGADFSAAGKGGAISLEAGSQINGASNLGAVLDIRAGSTIVLSVASAGTPAAVASAAAEGKFTGTLHLRAPQTAGGTDVNINAVAGQIAGASNIVVEGYRIYAPAGGVIDNVKGSIQSDAASFASNTNAITQRIFGAVAPTGTIIVPGAEIINATGDLTLNNDWDLSAFRFGPRGVPGVLTMRAAGNLIFNGALSDGFDSSFTGMLATAPLMAENSQLPVNAQSWTYRLTAGANLAAADFRRVQGLESLSATSGSLLLGKTFPGIEGLGFQPSQDAVTTDLLPGYYQVIRTGSGDITVSVGRDVLLLNPFATIYTAGTLITDPTRIAAAGDFDVPVPLIFPGEQEGLGAPQNQWSPQYSRAGGNVTITAQGDIAHQTRDFLGNLLPDSVRQTPNNWLYRRSSPDGNGHFAVGEYGDVASTSWWIDFSNFFEGVGALGGGDVTLLAGGNISNVDAVIPTNARMAGRAANGTLSNVNDAAFIELGGGNLLVQAGKDIDGGIYYVERGAGALNAGQSIHTNVTRAPSLSVVVPTQAAPDRETWLPTTLFVGKGSFHVTARGDITLGPTVNPFLLPQGVSNSFRYKTYFSTYAEDTSVDVTSLGGSITLRENATLADTTTGPILQMWLGKVAVLGGPFDLSVSSFEPWIRLSETTIFPFATATSLQPGTLRATAFSADINVVGNLTLAPSHTGTIDLLANGAINGLNIDGMVQRGGQSLDIWDSSRIILSDASPSSLPGVRSSFRALDPQNPQTDASIQLPLDGLFAESGSTLGRYANIQTQLALHDPTLLHADDPDPVHLYAQGGNIADLTLFSPKVTRVFAGKDITDVGLYLQNVSADDFTVVTAGRDIVAYNPNSPLQQQAKAAGNSSYPALTNANPALSGDIQISGPGTLEVLAGRNLDLGSGRNARDPADLDVGITSIGSARNPALPFEGADVIVAAGIGGPSALFDNPTLDFQGFIDKYLGANGSEISSLFPELSVPTGPETVSSDEGQAKLALEVFFRVLRDAGRDHNLATSPGFGSYAAGFTAISDLFGTTASQGDLELSSRSIKTAAVGDISILAPSGGLSLGFNIPDGVLVPPGIVTEHGGNISIFTDKSVQVGALRIFTLRGGNELIWSSAGDIAAGNASKTVQTAPPTRVVIDASSADVQTDLAGLATGGGIGVLATAGGVPPGDVDLIAPAGVVDAGDAGIRATGNLSIAAVRVLNADNIQVAGTSAGVPTAPAPPALNLGAITAANSASAAGSSAADGTAQQARSQGDTEELPSIITVDVVGYNGGEN